MAKRKKLTAEDISAGAGLVANRVMDTCGRAPTPPERQKIVSLVGKFGAYAVLDGLEDACCRYLHAGDPRSIAIALGKIGWCIWDRKQDAAKPYLNRLIYIDAICRNRFGERKPRYLAFLEAAHLAGLALDEIEARAKAAASWAGLRSGIEDWHRTHNPGDELLGGPE